MARGWKTTSVCKICGTEIGEYEEYCSDCLRHQMKSQENSDVRFWEEIPPIVYVLSWVLLVLPLSFCFIAIGCTFITRLIIYAVNILLIVGFISSMRKHEPLIQNKHVEEIKKAEAENLEKESERKEIEELGKMVEQCKLIDTSLKPFVCSDTEDDTYCPDCNCQIKTSEIICPQCRPKLASLVHEANPIGEKIVYCKKCDQYYLGLSECPICASKVSVYEDIVDDATDVRLEKSLNEGIQKFTRKYTETIIPINDTIAHFPIVYKEIQENYAQYVAAISESERTMAVFSRHKTTANQQAGLEANRKAQELLLGRAENLKKQNKLKRDIEQLPASALTIKHTIEDACKQVYALYLSSLETARGQVLESMRIYKHIIDHQAKKIDADE